MITIMVADDTSGGQELSNALKREDNEVTLTTKSEAINVYKQQNPSVTIMNFEEMSNAIKATEEIIKFDDKACVLALIDPNSENSKEEVIKTGAKAVINSPSQINSENVLEVVNNIYKVCCTIRNEKCMGCVLGENAE